MGQATYPEVVSDAVALLSGGQPSLTPPYLVLHCEEFAWPHVSPHAPVRSYIKPIERGRTVSPITRCKPSSCDNDRPLAGLFSVALVVARPIKASICPTGTNAPPLAGSLPCSVRTFLSLTRRRSSNRPTCSLARQKDYSKSVFNTYSTKAARC
jgi:hypothetical protein